MGAAQHAPSPVDRISTLRGKKSAALLSSQSTIHAGLCAGLAGWFEKALEFLLVTRRTLAYNHPSPSMTVRRQASPWLGPFLLSIRTSINFSGAIARWRIP